MEVSAYSAPPAVVESFVGDLAAQIGFLGAAFELAATPSVAADYFADSAAAKVVVAAPTARAELAPAAYSSE